MGRRNRKTKKKDKTSLLDLNNDTLCHVASFLRVKDLSMFMTTCVYTYRVLYEMFQERRIQIGPCFLSRDGRDIYLPTLYWNKRCLSRLKINR
jgi:hypothetical protein